MGILELPFTVEQFFGVFAEYNHAFFPAAVAFWVGSLGAIAVAWRNPVRFGRTLSIFLSVLWLWNAIAYHTLLFTQINPAAWLFAVLFGVQAVLLFQAGVRSAVEYFSTSGSRHAMGTGLVAYALAYPFITIALGHGYPATPTFGVPCPTAIFTMGMLLTTRAVPQRLAVIPILWGVVGGSAAFLLGVPTDYALLGAAVLLTVVLVVQRVKAER